MAFQDLKDNADDIQEYAKNYLESNLEYYKLWSFRAVMKSGNVLLKVAIVLLFTSLVLLFLSLAAAIAIGERMNNYAAGFLIVGLSFIVLFVVAYFVLIKVVEKPFLQRCSRFFFND